MARTLHVYPKAAIVVSTWEFVLKVDEFDGTGVVSRNRFEHLIPAGVTAEVPLTLLKLAFDLTVGDTDTDQDVDDALFLDDIKPGPQTETVIGNWIEIAEGIISGLPSGYTREDFQVEWAPNQLNAVRSDAKRALITQRGWAIDVGSLHYHLGDGSAVDE